MYLRKIIDKRTNTENKKAVQKDSFFIFFSLIMRSANQPGNEV